VQEQQAGAGAGIIGQLSVAISQLLIWKAK
jgi:hypothetical protein